AQRRGSKQTFLACDLAYRAVHGTRVLQAGREDDAMKQVPMMMARRARAKRESRNLIPAVAGEKRMLILNVAARRNGLRCGTNFAVGHAFILEKRNLVDQKAANNGDVLPFALRAQRRSEKVRF